MIEEKLFAASHIAPKPKCVESPVGQGEAESETGSRSGNCGWMGAWNAERR